jgi:hypothetical protein
MNGIILEKFVIVRQLCCQSETSKFSLSFLNLPLKVQFMCECKRTRVSRVLVATKYFDFNRLGIRISS